MSAFRDELAQPNSTVKARIRQVPLLAEEGLRPAQINAIKNLELSLGQGKPRALIQMASGGGKTRTWTSITISSGFTEKRGMGRFRP
jgi:type I site-specific restriction endonuclease